MRFTPRHHWDDEAGCVDEPLTTFFGTDSKPLKTKEAAKAIRICNACPVVRDCLLDALLTREFTGVRGGLTHLQRRTMLRMAGNSVKVAMTAWDRAMRGTTNGSGTQDDSQEGSSQAQDSR